MKVLGLNCCYHEDAAALLVDDRLVGAIEQERLNRRRHAKYSMIDKADEVPFEAIDCVLRMAGLEFGQLDYIASSLDPVERLRRNVNFRAPYPIPNGDWGSRAGELTFYSHAARIPQRLEERYGVPIAGRFVPLRHHLCHAASAFYASGLREAAVMVIDGIGEYASTWLGRGGREGLATLMEVDFPNSLGLVWDRLVEFLGFHPYDSAHLMALAAYGTPCRLVDRMLELVYEEGASFRVRNDVVRLREERRDPATFQTINGAGAEDQLREFFGIEPRPPGGEIRAEHMNLAFAAQAMLEHHVVRLASWLREQTGLSDLCYAGGVALNCVANYRLAKEPGFRTLFIQPAANDAGTSLGAAYIVAHDFLGHDCSERMHHALWGPEYDEDHIGSALGTEGIPFERPARLEEEVAEEISAGRIIGWYQGRMELGPRALGARSLLGDPRRGDLRDLFNRKVKHREWFRPLCPAVLDEDASDWFEIPEAARGASRFMLVACPVRDDRKEAIPAAVHVDGSARIQLVERSYNPSFHALLSAFKRRTGIPMVLNTSFNVKEPIVCTPGEAIRTCLRTEIDALAIGPFLARFRR